MQLLSLAFLGMQSYKPMLATSTPKPFSGNDWIFESKWDGFRAVAYVEGRFSLRSRNGLEFKYNFPELAELKQLASNVILDGEIVVMREGVADFQAMLERGKATLQRDIERLAKLQPATYIVFDILEKDGRSLVDLPLMQRKAILKFN